MIEGLGDALGAVDWRTFWTTTGTAITAALIALLVSRLQRGREDRRDWREKRHETYALLVVTAHHDLSEIGKIGFAVDHLGATPDTYDSELLRLRTEHQKLLSMVIEIEIMASRLINETALDMVAAIQQLFDELADDDKRLNWKLKFADVEALRLDMVRHMKRQLGVRVEK